MSKEEKIASPWLKEIVFPDIDREKSVNSVIVTMYSGSSYDNLFRQVSQKIPDGRVGLYSLEKEGITKLFNLMKELPIKMLIKDEEEEGEEEEEPELVPLVPPKDGEEEGEEEEKEKKEKETPKPKGNVTPTVKPVDVHQLIDEIQNLDPDCVLFNWECCAGCNDSGFYCKETIQFVEMLIKRGHTTMFSDFAVKALIGAWDEDRLGPKPFVKIGECSSSIELRFDTEELSECGVPQLEAVGKLCSTGVCILHCLGGTVVVGIDWEKIGKTAKLYSMYDLSVLTVGSCLDGYPYNRSPKHSYDHSFYRGSVGHAIVKYTENNGQIIVSAGHWIELSKLETSLDKVEEWAKQYGNEYANEMEFLKSDDITEEEKAKKMKLLSQQFVQQMPSVKSKKKKKSRYVYKK